jgi:hypothetical protein
LRNEAACRNFAILEKKLLKLCDRDLVQNASSSEMIKTVHGSAIVKIFVLDKILAAQFWPQI